MSFEFTLLLDLKSYKFTYPQIYTKPTYTLYIAL